MFSYAAATFISFSRRENFFSKLRSSLSAGIPETTLFVFEIFERGGKERRKEEGEE